MKMKMKLNLAISAMVLGVLLSLPHSGQATPFTFTKIADTNTSIPGGTGNFTLFEVPSLDDGIVEFTGFDSHGQTGFYTDAGGLLNMAPSPTSGADSAFLGVDVSGRPAIYTNVGGFQSLVVDTTTLIPSGLGNFDFFGSSPSFDGEYGAFLGGNASGHQGIYTNLGGSLNMVADTNTSIPGQLGNFFYFTGDLSFDAGNVAFLGFDAFGGQGIYTNTGGALTKVIGLNDSLDGKTVSGLSLGTGGLDGGAIAFTASFTGSEGIFVATSVDYHTPEPSTFVLFGVGAFGLLVYGQRRRKSAV